MTVSVAAFPVAVECKQRRAALPAMTVTHGVMSVCHGHHKLLSINLLRDLCFRGPHL